MIVFWLNDLPMFIHRLMDGETFEGPRFALVDEGDETTVISTMDGEGSIGPYALFTLGPFDLDAIGILALVSDALAKAKIPIFVISTYRYDHILVPWQSSSAATKALVAAGMVRKVKGEIFTAGRP
jgi:hypothetical protein